MTPTDLTAQNSVRVDLVFDVVCPWCFIGFRRLIQALAKRPAITPQFKWWPFMLDPEIPRGGVPNQLYMAAKFGDKDRAATMNNRIRVVGRKNGIIFNFNKIATMPPTIDVHRLLLYAQRHDRLTAVLTALFYGYFEDGIDIESHEILVDLAQRSGLNRRYVQDFLASDDERETVRLRAKQAIDLGVQGVPTFIFDGTYLVSGAMDATSLLRPLDVATTNRKLRAEGKIA